MLSVTIIQGKALCPCAKCQARRAALAEVGTILRSNLDDLIGRALKGEFRSRFMRPQYRREFTLGAVAVRN